MIHLFGHPRSFAEVFARVHGLVAELFLNAQELVVLGGALATARGARLDLASAQAHCQVGNVGVLSLSTAVAGHHPPVVLLGEFNRSDGLRHGADLVHLEQQTVGGFLLHGLVDLHGIGHRQVVAHHLHGSAHFRHKGRPIGPVVLVERVLHRHDGVLGDHVRIELHQLVAGKHQARVLPFALGLEVQVVLVLAFHLELGRRHVQANGALVEVARAVDGLHQHLQARLHGAGRREAALVANQGGVTAELCIGSKGKQQMFVHRRYDSHLQVTLE